MMQNCFRADYSLLRRWLVLTVLPLQWVHADIVWTPARLEFESRERGTTFPFSVLLENKGSDDVPLEGLQGSCSSVQFDAGQGLVKAGGSLTIVGTVTSPPQGGAMTCFLRWSEAGSAKNLPITVETPPLVTISPPVFAWRPRSHASTVKITFMGGEQDDVRRIAALDEGFKTSSWVNDKGMFVLELRRRADYPHSLQPPPVLLRMFDRKLKEEVSLIIPPALAPTDDLGGEGQRSPLIPNKPLSPVGALPRLPLSSQAVEPRPLSPITEPKSAPSSTSSSTR